jgi:hypothetical protein
MRYGEQFHQAVLLRPYVGHARRTRYTLIRSPRQQYEPRNSRMHHACRVELHLRSASQMAVGLLSWSLVGAAHPMQPCQFVDT